MLQLMLLILCEVGKHDPDIVIASSMFKVHMPQYYENAFKRLVEIDVKEKREVKKNYRK